MAAQEEAKVLLKKAVEDVTQMMETVANLPVNHDGTYTVRPAALVRQLVQIADTLSEAISILNLNQYKQK